MTTTVRVLRMTPRQLADHLGRHVNTVHRALESGEMHGDQRVAGGRWSIRTECGEAWQAGQKCEHQQVRRKAS